MATNPTSESELQLYRVLQRSNLLQYFETFISQGGDDVQQLCEAGEEEFLEIMALVGMASKPLHVRRLQKALQEWVTTPVFQQPLGPHTPPPPVAPGSILASVQRPYLKLGSHLQLGGSAVGSWPPTPVGDMLLGVQGTGGVSQSVSPGSVTAMDTGIYTEAGSMQTQQQQQQQQHQQQQQQQHHQHQQHAYDVDSPESGGANSLLCDERAADTSSPGPLPQLSEGQLEAIARSAEDLAKSLPHYEPKPLNTKKLINKEIEEVMKMPIDHPDRMDLLRKYGCIYGRFDSRRKNEKQLSLHEISVNEASAQLCKHRVTLLTRRDDLFPLARQVVRDSGYQYSKGHSRGQTVEIPPNKKPRMESFVFSKQYDSMLGMAKALGRKSPQKASAESRLAEEKRIREVRMSEINQELSSATARQQALKRQILQLGSATENAEQSVRLQAEHQQLMTRQLQLLTEQSDLLKKQRSARRSQYQRNLNKEGQDDSGEDDDEDSMPFPSETFPSNDNNEDYYSSATAGSATKNSANTGHNKHYSQSSLYHEGLRMIQKYSMVDSTGLQEGGIQIKEEIDPDAFREELEPGEVDPSTVATWHLPVRFSSNRTDDDNVTQKETDTSNAIEGSTIASSPKDSNNSTAKIINSTECVQLGESPKTSAGKS